MGFPYPKAKFIQFGLPLLVAILLSATPAGAESNAVETLVAELTPKAAEPGFAALAVSKARGLGKLADSVILISELLGISTRAEDIKALYVEMAAIQELLGRYEEASQSWEAAVAAQPGKGEPSWILSAAACKLAIGDSEAAAAFARAALLTTATPRLITLAMLIEARALVLSGDMPGALARSVDALAMESSGLEAAALSLARDASDGVERELYVKRLREKYPGWPETQDALATIFGLIHFMSTQSEGARIAAPVTNAANVSPEASASIEASVSIPDRQKDDTQIIETKPLYYQLGAFRDEANAILLSTRLVRAGFNPKTARRESGNGVLSIVYLEAGSDPSRLMVALKDAGFESWPLFAAP